MWIYRPASHKTEHHGHNRVIPLGPRAQAVVSRFLKADTSAHLFSPIDAESERHARQHRRRKTPVNQGNRPGTNRRRNPARQPQERYSRDSFRRAIERGIRLAFPHPELSAIPRSRLTKEQRAELKQWYRQYHWHPHQLRHTFATRIRREYGLEASKTLLGEATIAAAEIYAEQDRSRAAEIAARIG